MEIDLDPKYDFNKANDLCYKCKNFAGGCSWSRNFTPVEGWTAEPTLLTSWKDKRSIRSYHITECPEYEEGKGPGPSMHPSIFYEAVYAMYAQACKTAVKDRERALQKLQSGKLDDRERITYEYIVRECEAFLPPRVLAMLHRGVTI